MRKVYVLCGESESVNAYPERIPGTASYPTRKKALAALLSLLAYFGATYVRGVYTVQATSPSLLDY